MKFVLSKSFGGFDLSNWAKEQVGCSEPEHYDPKLIALIEEYGSAKCSGEGSRLEVIEIPDNTTDYDFDEYDGWETIIYVVNGKLYRA